MVMISAVAISAPLALSRQAVGIDEDQVRRAVEILARYGNGDLVSGLRLIGRHSRHGRHIPRRTAVVTVVVLGGVVIISLVIGFVLSENAFNASDDLLRAQIHQRDGPSPLTA